MNIHTCIHAYIHTYTHTYIHTFIHSYNYIYINTSYTSTWTVYLYISPDFPMVLGIPPLKNPPRPSDARPVPPWAPQKGDFFDGSETATVGLLRCPRDVSTREMVGKFKESLYIYIYSLPPNTKRPAKY